jgi:hypothetical protein
MPSTSFPKGIEGMAPYFWTVFPAARQHVRTSSCSNSAPLPFRTSFTAAAPTKVSPAAVVSTTFSFGIFSAGTSPEVEEVAK